MTSGPHRVMIMVAPNGARVRTADNPATPITPAEIADAVVRCPIINDPQRELAELTDFDELRAHLASLRSLQTPSEPAAFSRGAIEFDGRLDLCKQGLGAQGAELILPELRGTPIRHVLLGTNAIGAAGLAAVAAAIGTGSTIETVYLGCNGITAESLPVLAKAVAGSSSVKALWLKRNPLGAEAAPALAEMIGASQLETIDLVATGITDEGFTPIAEAIVRSPTLRHVFLSGNSLTAAAIELLADWIGNPRAESIHLSANPLGDDGVRVLSEAVRRRTQPMNLSISSVGLTVGSAPYLGPIAVKARQLDLGRSSMAQAVGAVDNVLGDDGLDAIGAQFATCALHWLDVRRCGFTDAGARSLDDYLDGDHAVEQIEVGPGINRNIKADIRRRLRAATGSRPEMHVKSRYR